MSASAMLSDTVAYPKIGNGAEISPLLPDQFRISLCGAGATQQEKLAFVCQYADECREKILLLDEQNTFCPKHKPSRLLDVDRLKKYLRHVGLIDVLPAATLGPRAECYAGIWNQRFALARHGYQRIFVATRGIDPWAQYAVLFSRSDPQKNGKLLQTLYDYDTTILGVVNNRNN